MMTYTNLRDEFLAASSPHVNDISRYCLHSIRAGGASAVANNGVEGRMFNIMDVGSVIPQKTDIHREAKETQQLHLSI